MDHLFSVKGLSMFSEMIVQFQNRTIVYIGRSHTLSRKIVIFREMIVYFQLLLYTMFDPIFPITKDCFQSTFFVSNLFLCFPSNFMFPIHEVANIFSNLTNTMLLVYMVPPTESFKYITRLGWSSRVW